MYSWKLNIYEAFLANVSILICSIFHSGMVTMNELTDLKNWYSEMTKTGKINQIHRFHTDI